MEASFRRSQTLRYLQDGDEVLRFALQMQIGVRRKTQAQIQTRNMKIKNV